MVIASRDKCAFTLSCCSCCRRCYYKSFAIVAPIIAIKSHLYLISSVSCICLSCWVLASLSLSIYQGEKYITKRKAIRWSDTLAGFTSIDNCLTMFPYALTAFRNLITNHKCVSNSGLKVLISKWLLSNRIVVIF